MSRPTRGAFALILALSFPLWGCGTTAGEESPEERTVDFYLFNAQHFYDGGRYQESIDQFEKALSVDDDNGIALLGRPWAMLMLGEQQLRRAQKGGPANIQVARDLFRELLHRDLDENDYKVKLGLGKSHLLLGDLYARRAELVRQRLAHLPESDPSRAALREAEERRRAEFSAAEALFSEVLSDKDNPAARDDLTALLLMARISTSRGDYAGALLFTERYLEQVRRSKQLWTQAIKRFPEDEAIWEAKLAGAVAKEIPARYVVSSALFKLERLAEAEHELDQVLLLDPDRMEAYLDRGIVRERRDDLDGALADYREYLVRSAAWDVDPEDPRIIEVTSRIERIEQDLFGPREPE